MIVRFEIGKTIFVHNPIGPTAMWRFSSIEDKCFLQSYQLLLLLSSPARIKSLVKAISNQNQNNKLIDYD